MVMFGLSDTAIIDTLRKKAKTVPSKIYYDHRSSPSLALSANLAKKVKTKGLLHQKILVLDNTTVFIGSANMTHASLSMHDNLMIGFYSPEIAHFLIHKAPYSSGYIRSMVGGQNIELWLLPDMQNKALSSLRELIHSAKKSIFVAMFTFTHPILVDELIKAHKRGVQVECVIDFQSSMGASGKVVEKLKAAHVPLYFSSGPQLLHHKMLFIDNKTLISGSANWTKSAFVKNNDCFFILHHLTPKQKRFVQKLKKVLIYHAKS